MADPKVYIVILNYLHWQDTRDCLRSVLQSSYTYFSVLVIDNNSRNNSLDYLIGDIAGMVKDYRVYTRESFSHLTGCQNLPALTFIQNEKNTGFAAGNNIALGLLSNEDAYVWLLNPDMIIKEDTLAELNSFATYQTRDCIIGAETRSFTNKEQVLFYGGGRVNFSSGTVELAKTKESMDKLDYISGACLFTHAANFKRLGLLPTDYFLYWEETDWCFRAKQQGYSLLVCPAAICYDKISTVIGKGFLANYYYCRNGLLFISKFRRKNIPVALLLAKLRWLKRIFTGQWNRARGIWKGTVDFLKKNFHEIQ